MLLFQLDYCSTVFVRLYLVCNVTFKLDAIFFIVVCISSMNSVILRFLDEVLVGFSGVYCSLRFKPLGWKVSSK